MLKIENTEVYGWEAAIRGMRNPLESWDKSDSDWYVVDEDNTMKFIVGPNDLALMKALAKNGPDHGKFLRMFTVTCDVVAPLYFWKEFKTYRAGRKFLDDEPDVIPDDYMEFDIEMNSCSTMHKIHAKEFTLDDFSHEHLTLYSHDGEICRDFLGTLEDLVDELNVARKLYLETKDKTWWWQMIQLLPTSYNQRRTVQLNYQVLKSMYYARRHHKLDEWHTFCDWVEELPYFKELCIQE